MKRSEMTPAQVAELEREEIENVFALGGGELEYGPETEGWHYWYEGPPEYATRELEKHEWARTAIEYGLFSDPPAPPGWRKVASFVSSGEAECWRCGAGTGNESERADCPLCEGSGYVYIGDGWREAVYVPEESADDE